MSDGQLIAESQAAADACWRAIEHPEQVRSLVLVSPTPPDAALRERLREIRAATLILVSPSGDTATEYQRAIPNAYRLYVYGSLAEKVPRLAAEFAERSDTFELHA